MLLGFISQGKLPPLSLSFSLSLLLSLSLALFSEEIGREGCASAMSSVQRALLKRHPAPNQDSWNI